MRHQHTRILNICNPVPIKTANQKNRRNWNNRFQNIVCHGRERHDVERQSCQTAFFSTGDQWDRLFDEKNARLLLDAISTDRQWSLSPLADFLNHFFGFKEEPALRDSEAASQPRSHSYSTEHPGGFTLVQPWLSDNAISDGAFSLTEPWPACSGNAFIFTFSEA